MLDGTCTYAFNNTQTPVPTCEDDCSYTTTYFYSATFIANDFSGAGACGMVPAGTCQLGTGGCTGSGSCWSCQTNSGCDTVDTCPGSCSSGVTCGTGCCDAGQTCCDGSTCVDGSECCQDSDCNSPPDACSALPATCSDGTCSYSFNSTQSPVGYCMEDCSWTVTYFYSSTDLTNDFSGSGVCGDYAAGICQLGTGGCTAIDATCYQCQTNSGCDTVTTCP